jgi:DNA ligase-3
LENQSLLHTPFEERRKILQKNVEVIENRIEMSEQHRIETEEGLWDLMNNVMEENQEGLVVKPVGSIYEPQARHWLKIKKDYLEGLGDSVDLNVLGCYWGTGNKGGQLTVFMCGVYDKKTNTWKTVSKVFCFFFCGEMIC